MVLRLLTQLDCAHTLGLVNMLSTAFYGLTHSDHACTLNVHSYLPRHAVHAAEIQNNFSPTVHHSGPLPASIIVLMSFHTSVYPPWINILVAYEVLSSY